MSLSYHPAIGAILMCDFDTGFRPPEMVKRRPVVIISPRLRQRENLVTVVPLSTTPPNHKMDYHIEFTLANPLPSPFNNPSMWAKCDMLATVGLTRLDRFKMPRHDKGPRKWVAGEVSPADLKRIRIAILHAIGLSFLTKQL